MSRCSYPTLPALWKLLAVGEGQSLPTHSPPTEHEVSSVGGSYRPPKPDSGGTPRGIDDGVGNALCLTTQLVMLEISWFRVTSWMTTMRWDLLTLSGTRFSSTKRAASKKWCKRIQQVEEESKTRQTQMYKTRQTQTYKTRQTQTYKTRQRKVYKRTQMVIYKTGQRKPCKVEKPYHRECIMQAVAIDPRCGNCREPISLDVDDDEVLIVGHVAAPPKCNICDRVITGIVLEGPQCSHNVHPNCLVQYNEHDDDNNSAINDDNAFDYEEPERASPTRNVAASDDNSADEYHPSNFKSPSDSDEYEPSDE
ncbi:hypothetical protein PC128_g26200 [Phytophthora cactorum]|nr:hypothetical protein PC128_g26200 [Phytophthora cactorum]